MSNANVVASIGALLGQAQRRELLPTVFDHQLSDYVAALEGLTGDQRRGIRDLAIRFVHAAHSDKEYRGEDPDLVAEEIRSWLKSVPQ